MFGTIRKHSQALWIPIIVLVSISMVWFFTNSDPSTLIQRGQGGTMTVGQQQVLIGAAVQYWQRTGQLPRRASDMLGAADLDGDGNRDVDGLRLMGAIRQDLLERVVELDIQFDDDAINSIIREQLSYPQGQFQQKTYDQLIQSFGEADVRMYFHDELAIRHLHQVMGLGGGMVSRRAVRPLVEQSLLKYDTEVAVFRASEYTNKVTNVTTGLIEYYTNNKATYKEDDRVKFAWLKIPWSTNATKQVIEQAQKYQSALYQGFAQHGTNLVALNQIATNLQPPLKIERIELGENNVTGHPLGSVFNEVSNGDIGDIKLPVVRGPEGLYFAGVEEKVEGSLPEFKNLAPERSNEVRLAFLEEETQNLAKEAGRAFYTNLTTALTEGNHTFDKFCRANKVEIFTVPLFSSTTQAGPAYAALTNRVELPELQRTVRGMDPSKEKTPVDRITDFNPNPNGGWILNLKQRVPAEPEEIEAELNSGVLAQRRRGFGQATQPHPVRNNFSQQGYQMAEPTWSLRQAERIKLKLYLAAKKDRNEEIDGKLEELGNQLAQLTQQASGEDIPEAELLKLTQQMDGLRQERRQLEGERDIISQAKTRLEELKK